MTSGQYSFGRRSYRGRILRMQRYSCDNKPSRLHRGQTRVIYEKREKYLKGKVVTFPVRSLILYQYPADLLAFFGTLLKKF